MALKLECAYATCTHVSLNSKTSIGILLFVVHTLLQAIFHMCLNSKTDLSFNNTDHNLASFTRKDFCKPIISFFVNRVALLRK